MVHVGVIRGYGMCIYVYIYIYIFFFIWPRILCPCLEIPVDILRIHLII